MNNNHHVHHHNLDQRHAAALRSLSPSFRAAVEQVLRLLRDKGWQPIVFSGCRSEKEQQALIKAGSGGTKSWHVAGRHEDRVMNGICFSIHGEAADIVDKRYLWSGPAANLNFKFWKDLGTAAKSNWLEWGGDWKTGQHPRDVAHVQLKAILIDQNIRGVLV